MPYSHIADGYYYREMFSLLFLCRYIPPEYRSVRLISVGLKLSGPFIKDDVTLFFYVCTERFYARHTYSLVENSAIARSTCGSAFRVLLAIWRISFILTIAVIFVASQCR